MAEPLLDGLRVATLGDQQRRVAVAQVVESHAVEVFGQRLSDRRLEDALVEVAVPHGAALRRGEHRRVRARVAEVRAQLLDQERGQLHGAAGAVGLGVVLDKVAAGLRHRGEHDDLGVVQPEMAAAQRRDLARAQAGVGASHSSAIGPSGRLALSGLTYSPRCTSTATRARNSFAAFFVGNALPR